ncbi:MAG: ABC transporter substrate-binding protein, partial [Sulfuricella sp.]
PLTCTAFSALRGWALPLLLPCAFLLPSPADARDILIGQSIDISGPLGDIGKDYLAGAKVYFDYINSTGGIHGRKIVHIAVDNGGSAEKSAQISRNFLAKQNVDILFGYFGEGSMDELLRNPEFETSKIPLVAPLSGIELKRGNDHIFFVRPSYASEARKLVGHFLSLGITRFAAVYAADSYGSSALAAVEGALKSKNMALMGKYPVGQEQAGLDAAIKSTLASKPQAIIVILETLPAAQFIKAYRQVDAGTYIFGLSMINHQTLFEIAGKDLAAGVMLSEVVPHPSNWSVPVVAEHRKIMEIYRDEAPSHLTLEGFIAAKMLVSALRNIGKDFTPAQLTAALKETKSMDIGGFYLEFSPLSNRGSRYVDINVITRKGRLLN